MKNKSGNNYGYLWFLVIFMFLFFRGIFQYSNDGETSSELVTNNSTEAVKQVQETETKKIEKPTEPETSKDDYFDSLSEADFKAQCKSINYDTAVFGDCDDIEGSYVSLKLLVTGYRFFNMSIPTMIEDMVKEYDLQRNFAEVGIMRDTAGFCMEPSFLLFSNKYNLTTDDSKQGKHIIAYGKVISCSNNSKNGYNVLYMIPKYIDYID